MAARRNPSGPTPDLLVVGGGAIGLACAREAARRGMRVRVLERERPGAGASGVAAGMLAPVGEATWGEERIVAAALASHARWSRFAEELAAEVGDAEPLVRSGALHAALDRDEGAELRRRFALMRELGLEADWLAGRECRALEPGLSPRVVGGVHAAHEAAVDPAAVVAALARSCERAGVELAAGAEVVEAIVEAGAVRGVRTADGGRHDAGQVLLAAGAWSAAGWLPAQARPPVRPVKGQILTLRGAPGTLPAGRIVVTERVYCVPRADGRFVVGASVEELGFDLRITAGAVLELLREAYRALPDVAELELEHARAGLRPGTPDNAPIVGRGALDGLLLATGHFRNGILLAPLTAEAIGELATGGEPPPELALADPARFAADRAEALA